MNFQGPRGARARLVEVYEMCDYTCAHCRWSPPVPDDYSGNRPLRERVAGRLLTLEIDHILPIAHGGMNDEENLQALCNLCNGRKGTSLDDYYEMCDLELSIADHLAEGADLRAHLDEVYG